MVIGLLCSLMNCCFIFWEGWTAVSSIATGVGSIATALMAFIALRSLWQNDKQLDELKKQREEETRARLVFEIVSYEHLFLLKITNVGKSTAYDLTCCIKSKLIDNHFSDYIKSTFERNNQKRFVMVPGRSLYFYLSPIHTTRRTHIIDGVSYTSEVIDHWLNQYQNEAIVITGSYCGKYEIKECFSINDFMGDSIVVHDDEVLALQGIIKEIKRNYEKCNSIPVLLDRINGMLLNDMETNNITEM